MSGIYYDDLQPGQRIAHALHRTVTETDNLLITTLTHNPATLHLDAEAMRDSEFGQVLVNSCFTLSLMIGVSVGDTTHGTAIANLGFDEARFPEPVFIGDTLHFETEVTAKRDSRSRPEAGIVTFQHRAFNQDDTLVATCSRVALVERRPAT